MILTQVVERVLAVFGTDERRINHALKVYGFASAIADLTGVSEFEKEVVALSSLLHDISIHEAERKYFSAAGKYQEKEGPPIAKKILEECAYPPDVVERVLYIIGNHHSYNKIDGLDFQILVEGDFLVNIHEEQMERQAVLSVREKTFRTESGLKLLDMMYLGKTE